MRIAMSSGRRVRRVHAADDLASVVVVETA
jgi:hypothetical protein